MKNSGGAESAEHTGEAIARASSLEINAMVGLIRPQRTELEIV